jgi:short-subunit dehydrogenase
MINETETPFAVVTGASSGIGFELAREFAEHGFDLLIAAEGDGIEDAAGRLRAMGAKVETVSADLAEYEGVETLYERIRSSGRPIDAIAINAGVGVGGPFAQNDLDDELNLIALNVVSVVHLSKRIVQDMVARNEGRILFTSSIAAEAPAPYEAVYGASKAFVQSFAEALRDELRNTNITITALQPGATETNFFHRAGMDDTKVGTMEKSDPADVARQGFEALMAGKDHVVAAMAMEQAQVAMGKVMPETTKAKMHREISKPGSANP